MKREDISDALGLVDESMISHALMVRRKKKKFINTPALPHSGSAPSRL